MSVKFVHVWEVSVSEFDKYEFNKKLLGAPFYLTHNNVSLKFCPRIYPQGMQSNDGVEHRDSIANFVGYEKGPWPKLEDITCVMGVQNQNTFFTEESMKKTISLELGGMRWGYFNFLTRDLDQLRRSGMISASNTIRICYKITIPQKHFSAECIKEFVVMKPNPLLPCWRPNDTKTDEETFQSVIAPKRDPEFHSDFTVIARHKSGADREFYCHKLVLNRNWHEFLSSFFEFAGVQSSLVLEHPSAVVEDVLRYAYSGCVTPSISERVMEVLDLANYLMFWPMKSACQDILVGLISRENVLDLAHKAELLNLVVLRAGCERMMITFLDIDTALEYIQMACRYDYKVLREMALTVIAKNMRHFQLFGAQEIVSELDAELWREIEGESPEEVIWVERHSMTNEEPAGTDG